MRNLADRMGLRDPALQESDREIAASALPAGLSLADLEAKGWWKSPPEESTRGDRKEKWKLAGEPIGTSLRKEPELLQLLTPKAHFFLNSIFANMPRQRKSQGPPALEMHPVDATARGLVDGQRVVLVNDRAEIGLLLRVSDAVCEGVVVLEGKWWDRPGETSAVSNLFGESNQTPSGQPTYNDLFVRVMASSD